ncbi:MAG: carboxynorspermidine decarboxylase [Chitinivibrionales bacterium]|nr:carboxynorspermidine decarboxylase [Chitinivibrionales bacterium]MBD3395185.1 carboxynorspermidine decarboxylase [Chitinivibrionales bacterium]
MKIQTPYYFIDERKLLRNLKRIRRVRELSGARSVLALKCFSTWTVFPLMREYLDGTTSSSLYEARLGHEKFGKETHAYCVGYTRGDIRAVKRYADKIIFNSKTQLDRFYRDVAGKSIGLRINPGFSHSHFDLADPARRYSRLGVVKMRDLRDCLPAISGVMFHFNCENDSFKSLSASLDRLSDRYGSILDKLSWVSLGGGLYFTRDGYPLEKFCLRLKRFAERHGIEVYLEPGEAVITESAELVTKVVDIVRNEIDIAVIDASIEAHMLDLLIYREAAEIAHAGHGRYRYMIAGRSCLAGDVFGTYRFRSRLKVGSTVRIADAAGYSMVKKNWFNGLQQPSIVVKRLDGSIQAVRRFDYRDFRDTLS